MEYYEYSNILIHRWIFSRFIGNETTQEAKLVLHSIIIPCYKSSRTIREVVELTSAELDRLGRPEYEFILVDDYSPDNGATLRELKALAADYPFVKAISLAKNSGQHLTTHRAIF